VRDQSVAGRPHRNRALALRDDDAGEGGLARLGNSLAQHGIDIASCIAAGRSIVRGIVVNAIDRIRVDFSIFITDELSTLTLSKSSSLSRT